MNGITMIDKLNIFCWNVEGIMSGVPYLLHCLDDLNIHICGLAEHWLRQHNLDFIKNIGFEKDYIVYAKPVFEPNSFQRKCTIRGGVALLCHKSLKVIDEIETGCDRIIGIEIDVPNFDRVFCFAVYLPASSRPLSLFKEYIDQLETLCNVYSERGRVFLLGDMNVKVQGPKYQFKNDARTLYFQNLLSMFDFMSVNVQDFCRGPVCTYFPKEGNGTAIDHILVASGLVDQIHECRVLDDHCINVSDHHPVFLSVKLPRVTSTHAIKHNPIRLSWKKAKSSDGALNRYKQLSTQELCKIQCPPNDDIIDNSNIEQYHVDIINTIKHTAENVIPKIKFAKYLKPYWSKEINSYHNVMQRYRTIWTSQGKPRGMQFESYLNYKRAKNEFRNNLTAAFNKYISEQLNEMDKAGDINQELFWTVMNRGAGKGNTQAEIEYKGTIFRTPADIANAWSSHFSEVFTEPLNNRYDDNFKNQINRIVSTLDTVSDSEPDKFLEEPFSVDEISNICVKLKDGKAGGIDGITYEHLKYGGNELFEHLTRLFNLIVKNEYIPQSWKHGVIVTIHKGKNKPKRDVNSYRGITLLPVVFKVFEMLLANRLEDILDSTSFPSKQQMAYRKSLSSLHTAFNLQESIYTNTEQKEQVHVAFLDSARAFDTVWHEGLLFKLYQLGVTNKCWRIFRRTYTNMKSCVYANGVYSDWFNINIGIRQGSALSAKLYLLYIDELLQSIEKSKLGSMILDIHVNVPTQADDICLVSNKVNELQKMVHMCEQYSINWRFQFSASKSNIVSFRSNHTSKLLNNKNLTLFDSVIPITEEITHVGIVLNAHNNSIERTVKACKVLKSVTMSLIKSGVHPAALNPITSSKIIKQVGFTKALYGCELWLLTGTELIMLERANRFVAKSIQGFDQRVRSDMCIGTLGWTTIEAYIDTKKLLFLGNLCRLSPNTLPKRIFITRLYMFLVGSNSYNQTGFIPDISRILVKYNLFHYLSDFLKTGLFTSKYTWKNIVKNAVWKYEEKEWMDRIRNDVEFHRFTKVHPKLRPHILWKLAVKYPEYTDSIHFVVKLTVSVRDLNESMLCHKCGMFYTDLTIHISLNCNETELLRDQFWCFIIDQFDINFSVYLHSLSDYDVIHVLMGGSIEFDMHQKDRELFAIRAAQFIHKTAKLYFAR